MNTLKTCLSLVACVNFAAACGTSSPEAAMQPTARYERTAPVTRPARLTDMVESAQIDFAADHQLTEWLEAQRLRTRATPQSEHARHVRADFAVEAIPEFDEQSSAVRDTIRSQPRVRMEVRPLEGSSCSIDVDSDNVLWEENPWPLVRVRFQADLEQMTPIAQELCDDLGKTHGTVLTVEDLRKGFTFERGLQPNETWSKIIR